MQTVAVETDREKEAELLEKQCGITPRHQCDVTVTRCVKAASCCYRGR